MPMSRPTHAVVLGGGLAGMLASTVLARHMDRVTVVERDALPSGPELRRGVPQARHAHLLWSGGARAIESLLPGTTDRLLAAGAHRLGLPQDIVWFTPYGWQYRFPGAQFMITCSRALLDWVVTEQALRNPRITLLEESEATGLTGDGDRVGGVQIRSCAGGSAEATAADFVVDTTGRGSAMRRWLTELGLPEAHEDIVDTGMAYATRLFRAPEGVRQRFPMVNIAAEPGVGRPGRNGALVPVEDGRWLVTLAGTRGGLPPTDDDGFLAFARGLRHPLMAELLEKAEPLTPVQGSRSTVNRRVCYEQFGRWPDGLVVLGDALAAFNPVYGHGMSCAARSCVVLDGLLERRGVAPGTAWEAQQAIAEVVDDPWLLATTQDIGYPDCRTAVKDPRIGPRPSEQQQFADLVGTAALHDPLVSATAMQVTALVAPMRSLESPYLIAALRKNKPHLPLQEPPFTPEEQMALHSHQRSAALENVDAH